MSPSSQALIQTSLGDLPLDTAKAIGRAEYWTPYQCDQFHPAVGLAVFDAAYNGGHPAQWLQQAAGATPDGVIGAKTIAAVRSADPYLVCMRIFALRELYLDDLPALWPRFGRGWVRRCALLMLAVS